jgi:uncharacterized protein YggT (Ycf19 family)
MGLIDFILNLAGLLLWLNWRAAKADPLGKSKPATLVGTLRRAEPGSAWARWQLPAVLGSLLLLRALFYWQIGSAIMWTGRLDLGVTVLSFSSNSSGPMPSLLRMAVFSVSSFALMLGIFYSWLTLLSIMGGPMPTHQLVKMQLGKIDGWASWVKSLLPLAITALVWMLASGPFAWMHIIPPPVSEAHRLGESLVIALGGYLVWKYLIAALLALHLLNSYIYFGKNPFWNYVNATAKKLLQPLEKIPLRVGKADFAPVVGIALVFLLACLVQDGIKMFPRVEIRGTPPSYLIDIHGLVDLYRWLSL